MKRSSNLHSVITHTKQNIIRCVALVMVVALFSLFSLYSRSLQHAQGLERSRQPLAAWPFCLTKSHSLKSGILLLLSAACRCGVGSWSSTGYACSLVAHNKALPSCVLHLLAHKPLQEVDDEAVELGACRGRLITVLMKSLGRGVLREGELESE